MTIYRLGLLKLEELKSPKHGWQDVAPPLELMMKGYRWKRPEGERDPSYWDDVFGFSANGEGWFSDLIVNIEGELLMPSEHMKVQLRRYLAQVLGETIVPAVVRKLLQPYTMPTVTMPKWRLTFEWDMPEYGLTGPLKRWKLSPAMTLKVDAEELDVMLDKAG